MLHREPVRLHRSRARVLPKHLPAGSGLSRRPSRSLVADNSAGDRGRTRCRQGTRYRADHRSAQYRSYARLLATRRLPRRARADAGTVAEVGFAAGIGLICFGLRTDLRESGEAGSPINPQVEIFIIETGGQVATSLQALLSLLT